MYLNGVLLIDLYYFQSFFIPNVLEILPLKLLSCIIVLKCICIRYALEEINRKKSEYRQLMERTFRT